MAMLVITRWYIHMDDHLGLSENRVYSQWNSHLIGIMISKTIGFRGTRHFQTHPFYENSHGDLGFPPQRWDCGPWSSWIRQHSDVPHLPWIGSLRVFSTLFKGLPGLGNVYINYGKSWKDPPFLMGKSTISTGPCSSSQTVSLPEASFHHQKLRLSDVLFSSWSNCRKWMEMVAECDRSIFGGEQGQGPGVYTRVVWLQDDWRRLLYIVNETGMKQV